MPSGLGAEPKKVAILIGLLATAGGVYWMNQEPQVAVATAPRAAAPQQQVIATPAVTPRNTPKAPRRAGNDDFHPTLKLPEDFDLSKVDPTLRTELLAKVREVGDAGGSRSLFEFYVPPPPPPKPVEPIKPDFAAAARQAEAAKPKPVDPGPPKPPPPPPIPLKYYGYVGKPSAGKLQDGLFIDGDETWAKGAGETIRNRYRVVRIGPTSAEVEDTVAKNTQTLRILERCEDSNTCK
jgi:hypothetical protein